MAIGDVVSALSSIADDAYLTIQPAAGVEWCVKNILFPATKAVELYFYDGTNEVLLDSASASWVSYSYDLNNTRYLRVKNVSGAAIYIGYTGIVTKE